MNLRFKAEITTPIKVNSCMRDSISATFMTGDLRPFKKMEIRVLWDRKETSESSITLQSHFELVQFRL